MGLCKAHISDITSIKQLAIKEGIWFVNCTLTVLWRCKSSWKLQYIYHRKGPRNPKLEDGLVFYGGDIYSIE